MVMGKLSTDSLAIAAKNAAHAIVRNLTIAHKCRIFG